MAIKVKHDVNAAPVAVASTAAGRARRQMETARLMAGSGRTTGGGGTGGGGAHPIAPPTAHAQLLSAHAPTPVNWELQRWENAAQEAARATLADRNNAAAKERAQMGIDADAAKLKSQQDFSKAQREAEKTWREQQAENAQQFSITQDEAKRKAAQEVWDRQHGILRQERDADLIAAGTHEYGFSPEVQRQADKLQKEYDEGLASGNWTEDEQAQFKAQLDQQLAALPKTLVQRKDPEGLFRNNTFTDEQGRIFSTDGKLLYNPAEAETRQREYQMKMQDMEDKRYMDALMKLEQGYRTSEPIYKVNELGEAVKDANGNPVIDKYNSSIKPYTDEQKQAILQKLFPNRFANIQPGSAGAQPVPAQPAPASANPAPAAQPTAQPTATQTPGVKPLPQNATPQQAADYAAQFKRKKK